MDRVKFIDNAAHLFSLDNDTIWESYNDDQLQCLSVSNYQIKIDQKTNEIGTWAFKAADVSAPTLILSWTTFNVPVQKMLRDKNDYLKLEK